MSSAPDEETSSAKTLASELVLESLMLGKWGGEPAWEQRIDGAGDLGRSQNMSYGLEFILRSHTSLVLAKNPGGRLCLLGCYCALGR